MAVLGGREPKESDGRVFPPLPPPEPELELELEFDVVVEGEADLQSFLEGGGGCLSAVNVEEDAGEDFPAFDDDDDEDGDDDDDDVEDDFDDFGLSLGLIV